MRRFRARTVASKTKIALSPNDEIGASLVNSVEPFEVDVTSVEQIDVTGH